MNFFVLGLSHKTAPVNLREKFAIPEEELVTAAERIRGMGIPESFVISTCNRVELYGAGDVVTQQADLIKVFAQVAKTPVAHIEDHLYLHRGEDAVIHLFRVAASLDSMVVGEPQILGQLKAAFALCKEGGVTGPEISRVVERAFSVAKRVRTDTGIANNVVSVSSIAADLAQQIFGRLDRRAGALIGAGKMGQLAAQHLRQAGLKDLIVANRSFERAQMLASKLGGHPRGLTELPRLLKSADIVITSTGARTHLIDLSMMKSVMKARKHRPIFFIDIAVPRNVSPNINELDNVYVYDVDDLTGIADQNLTQRQREAAAAEEMIVQYAQRFLKDLVGKRVTPTIVALRRHAEDIKRVELERALGRGQDAESVSRKAIEQVADGITNKLLHGMMTELKKRAGTAQGDQLVNFVRDIFELSEEEDK